MHYDARGRNLRADEAQPRGFGGFAEEAFAPAKHNGKQPPRYSLISVAAWSVCIKLRPPITCRSAPGWVLRALMAAATSPSSRVELCQWSVVKRREATCFFAALSVCATGWSAGR